VKYPYINPKVLAFALILILAMTPSCRRQGDGGIEEAGIEITVGISPDPAVMGAAEMTIQLEKDQAPIEGVELSVKGDMTHAGMMPVLRDGVEREPGIYHVPFEWTMAGDWIVSIDGTLPDGEVFTHTFETTVLAKE
jgi:hypothetical protein